MPQPDSSLLYCKQIYINQIMLKGHEYIRNFPKEL